MVPVVSHNPQKTLLPPIPVFPKVQKDRRFQSSLKQLPLDHPKNEKKNTFQISCPDLNSFYQFSNFLKTFQWRPVGSISKRCLNVHEMFECRRTETGRIIHSASRKWPYPQLRGGQACRGATAIPASGECRLSCPDNKNQEELGHFFFFSSPKIPSSSPSLFFALLSLQRHHATVHAHAHIMDAPSLSPPFP